MAFRLNNILSYTSKLTVFKQTQAVMYKPFFPLIASRKLFSTNFVCYKKQDKKDKKGKNSKDEEAEEVEDFDSVGFLKSLQKNYDQSLDLYKKKSAESKMGKANTKIFDNLKVHLSHGKIVSFLEVAQTTLKGRNLQITLFDPSDSKHVISSVIGSGLNLNPQADPKNPQLLKVPLPSPTSEVKAEAVKKLKEVLEHFKNAGNNKYSLSSIRATAMKELKVIKQKDELRKVTKHVEDLHQKYLKKLLDLFKDVEKNMSQ